TQEKIDPVRFLTNRSSGKMGFALAEAAANEGADVTLVTGPVNLETGNKRINRVDVVTAEEMYKEMYGHFRTSDIVIKAAAVADYRPERVYDEKIKKQTDDWDIEMERTHDILQSLGKEKDHQFLAGFAAETTNPVEHGISKLQKKNLDAIIVNNVAAEGAGFRGDTNVVTYVNKSEEKEDITLRYKQEIAEEVLKLIARDMKDETM